MENMTVGFIGQGYVGKNYADDFEQRGFAVVRYALEEPYRENKHKIQECDVVFIAVPTPTTPNGFDASIVRNVLSLVGAGKIAVIKSTIIPGLTQTFQKEYPDITVLFSPEFLSEATAAHDASNPFTSIVGMSANTDAHRRAAEQVMSILPWAPHSLICTSEEAELIKYAHNINGYSQIVTYNLLYDMAHKMGVNWEQIGQALSNDPFICSRYVNPVHKGGRGAGGHCFIKDFEAFIGAYRTHVGNEEGIAALEGWRNKNLQLLADSKKDIDIVQGVYGDAKSLSPQSARLDLVDIHIVPKEVNALKRRKEKSNRR